MQQITLIIHDEQLHEVLTSIPEASVAHMEVKALPRVNPMEPMTKGQLFALIDDIHERIHEGDSFEGRLIWAIPDPDEDDLPEIVARVEACYRIGNRDGQGGMRMIGVEIHGT